MKYLYDENGKQYAITEVADFENVTVGGWDEAYKLPGGIMILRHWDKLTIDKCAQWGNWYDAILTTISNKPIPEGTFIHTPQFFVGASGYDSSNHHAWCVEFGHNGNKTRTPEVYAASPHDFSGRDISYAMLVVGRWK